MTAARRLDGSQPAAAPANVHIDIRGECVDLDGSQVGRLRLVGESSSLPHRALAALAGFYMPRTGHEARELERVVESMRCRELDRG